MTDPQHGLARTGGDPLGASYRLVDRIGTGAVGEVWRVRSVVDGSMLAAKILKPEHARDPGLVERFVRERSLLLGLQHPHIVTVRDLVVEGETLAIVMDLVPGGSLRQLLTGRGNLAAASALTLSGQIFEALAFAHGRGVVHRDIKPDNILVTPGGPADDQIVAQITDFGISSVLGERDRRTTGLLGTPQYLAPELISNGHTGRATDIYAAGILLYELLAGRTPFAGDGNDFTIAYRHVTLEPPRLALPDPLWELLAALLAKDPGQRPSATQAAAEVRRLASQFAALAPLPPVTEQPSYRSVAHPMTVVRADLVRGDEPQPTILPTDPGTSSAGSVTPSPALAALVPDLGPADGHTRVRPVTVPPVAVAAPEPEPARTGRWPAWLTRTVLWWICGGLVLALGLGLAIWWSLSGRGNEVLPPDSGIETHQQDRALPTGLTIDRAARYDPVTKTTRIEFSYQAQKSPLSGSFLEVIPGRTPQDPCPAVTWEGVQAAKHQAATTGLTAQCGWRLDAVKVPAGSTATFTAVVPGAFTTSSELSDWLQAAARATQDALADPLAKTTAYPIQRLRGIVVKTPDRAVSQTTLPVVLLPVWPSGLDEANPLYQSPAVGSPSQMLVDVAGGESGVRFSDSCAGAVAVSSDGLVVTALSVTTGCSLHASVGNFTALESAPFSITTR